MFLALYNCLWHATAVGAWQQDTVQETAGLTLVHSENVLSEMLSTLFEMFSGGGVQHDSGVHRDVSFRSLSHDHKGSEQSKHLPGNLLRSGASQDRLHQQLQHVSLPPLLI